MKSIKHIVACIQWELDGAERYAKHATEYKDKDRTLADVYARAADSALANVDMLHAQAVRLIQAYKASGKGDVPAAMQAVWDWEHERMVDTIARVKMLLNVYRTPSK